MIKTESQSGGLTIICSLLFVFFCSITSPWIKDSSLGFLYLYPYYSNENYGILSLHVLGTWLWIYSISFLTEAAVVLAPKNEEKMKEKSNLYRYL